MLITPSLTATQAFESVGVQVVPLTSELMNHVRDVIASFRNDQTQLNLVIIDDCVSHLTGMSATDKRLWTDLLYNGRHLLGSGNIISTWVTSQYFRKIPKAFRTPLQGLLDLIMCYTADRVGRVNHL